MALIISGLMTESPVAPHSYLLMMQRVKFKKMFFCEDETTINYFTILKDYILTHGVPRAFYFDKNGVFRVNHPEAKRGNGLTQFGRVLQTLGRAYLCPFSSSERPRRAL